MGERERRDVQLLVLQMTRLAQAMTDAANDVARDPDVVSTMPVTLMFALDMEGPMRPTAVQALTGLSSGGVTKLVERLEQKGLVTRKTGAIEGDRRGVLVELTRRGRNTVRSISDAMASAKKQNDALVDELAQTLA
jgi:DNA-binding MarR family transcriptional regulator